MGWIVKKEREMHSAGYTRHPGKSLCRKEIRFCRGTFGYKVENMNSLGPKKNPQRVQFKLNPLGKDKLENLESSQPFGET